ncbi:MAG: Ferrous-iron efflux pump FieF [Smithella sp. PtaU1.Bin162]|nr:MAG: Ferrous-iron efflux pump FieF [Smithella sp. PtaU1.Bin162]
MDMNSLLDTDAQSAKTQIKSLWIYLGVDLASLLPIGVVALMSGSTMLLADLLDYSKSIASAFISILILVQIVRKRTGRFEFGIGKLSTFGALIISLGVLFSILCGMGIAFYRIIHPTSIENAYTLTGAIFQVFGIFINMWLMMRNLKLSKKTGSPLMAATWRIAFADMLLCVGILFALVMTYLLREQSWSLYIDPVCAIVALAIGCVSYISLFKQTVADLLDLSLGERQQIEIMKTLAECFDLYSGFHGVKTRSSGGKACVELTLSFPGKTTVEDALLRIDKIRQGIATRIGNCEVNVIIAPSSD